jgi:putative ABC transport system permease protein
MLLPEQQIDVDSGVLVFALAISTAAGVLFGLVPALHISRDASGAALREGRRHTDAPGTRRLRSMLIVAEIAISVTLVIGAFLVTRSFVQLTNVDPGFQAGEVTSFQLAVSGTQYPEGTQAAFYDRLYERLRRIPGVDAVGGVNILPLSGGYSCDGVQIDGRPVPKAQQRCAEARSASPDYFRAMGIPLIRGRLFTAGDDARARRRVVVINEAMAREFFPGEDPLGRGVIYNSRGQSDSREVVGIIGNVHHFGLDQVPTPEFYTPQPQPPSYHGMTIVMRGHTDPASVMSAVRAEVRALAPDAPIYNVRTLEHLLDASVADARFRTLLLTSFAGLALLLAVVGTYSVISLLVTQRTQEMGIRLALGARPSDILRLVLGAGITPLALGTGIGLAGGMGATRALAGLLFNVTALDPLAFVSAAVVILLAGLLATWIPARRACRVDPVVALRTP